VSIELHNISKSFQVKGKKIQALDNVSLNIPEGSFVGLLGPNGAGKTTLTRILATLLLPDSGEGFIDGIPLSKDKKIREIIGTVFGESGGRTLYYRLSIYDNLLFYSTLAGVPKKEAKKRINILLDYFNLTGKKNVLAMKLSTGMKAKVLLIRALVPLPKVLLLDEPTLGFDLISFEKAKKLLKALNKEFNITTLLTSHNFAEIEDLTPNLILIEKGKIIDNCTQCEFKEIYSKKQVEISFNFNYENLFMLQQTLKETLGSAFFKLEKVDNTLFNLKIQLLKENLEKLISRIVVLLVENYAEILEIKPHVPSLREAFLAYLERKRVSDTTINSEKLQLLVER